MIVKKQILWLIAIAIITVMVSSACSEKPTDAKNFSVMAIAGRTPTPEFSLDNASGKLTIDSTKGLIQFKDLSFKSGAYYQNGDRSKVIYFYAYVKVDSSSKPYIGVITKDANGNVVEETGKFYTVSEQKGAVYDLEGVRYRKNIPNSATATFVESGYLRIKFSNYGAEIVYSLTTENSPVEVSTGGYIPEMYHGNYVFLSGNSDKIKSAYVGPIRHDGNKVDGIEYDRSYSIPYVGQWTWLVTESDTTYLGNNTWEETFTTGWDMPNGAWKNEPCVKKFTLTQRGQRILTTTSQTIGETVLIHEDDVYK